jgi:hypothetical protein
MPQMSLDLQLFGKVAPYQLQQAAFASASAKTMDVPDIGGEGDVDASAG